MRRWGEWLGAALISFTCGCSSDDGGSPPNSSAGQGQAAQAGTTISGGASSGGASSGGASSAGNAGQAQSMAGLSSATDGLLSNGDGREYKGIVNLVDPAAAQALDDYILEADPIKGGSGKLTLELATRHFYQYYADEYDIVFFLSDHALNTSVAGLHTWVSKPSLPGTGAERPVCTGRGPAHLGSVVGIQVGSLQEFPPFAHEFAHHYGVHLDDKLGFGHDVNTKYAAHWGLTGANGQLGGFDAASLGCETPVGAKPPNCTPTATGRYHYTVNTFFPASPNTWSQPFGPLELYLMGLLPAAEVPSPIIRFDGADFPFETLVETNGKITIDAAGLSELKISDIVARHGEVPALPANKRQFKAAVVLLTAAPAAQPILDRVAEWAAIFGGEITSTNSDWVSFAKLSGGRASMSCRVGARHDRVPDEALEFTCPTYHLCDPQTQNCPAGLACYGIRDLYCAPPGVLDDGAACEQDQECKSGSVCVPTAADFSKWVCAPYCDPLNANAPNACAKLCPVSNNPITDFETLKELGAFCLGGAGGACNPLLQDCATGRACTGVEATGCEVPGIAKLGEVCLPFDAPCEKGSVCVGIQGEAEQFCQSYCDPAPTAPAASACDSKCPNGAWEFTGYGICIP
ncbi:MAG TPA: hypothetical protein VJV79_12975 [Polyangiaceae bacterium]|nr:hypothetical protein [Polyangiaceae bacterium]